MPNMALDLNLDTNNMMSFDDCVTQCRALNLRIAGTDDQFNAAMNTGCDTNSENQWIDVDGDSVNDPRYNHAAQTGHTTCPTAVYPMHTLQDQCYWQDSATSPAITAPNAKDNAGWFLNLGWTQVARSTPDNFASQQFTPGNETLTFSFDDVFGNTLTCDTTVSVSDTQAPIIASCPNSQSLSTEAATCAATAIWQEPSITDNCGHVMTTQSHQSGLSFPHGTTPVSYFGSDNSASSPDSWCNFTISVVDHENPLLACTVGTTHSLPGSELSDTCSNGMGVPMGCSASDNCQQPADLSISCTSVCTAGCCMVNQGMTRQLGDSPSFDVGQHQVTCSTSDASNNAGTVTKTIEVTDSEIPTLTGCVTSDVTLNASETTATALYDYDAVTSSDNSCNVTHGRVSPTIGIPLQPGVYEVMYEASDCSNNQATCSWNVSVVDVHAPEWVGCPTGGITVDAAVGQPWGIAHWTVPNATDASTAVGHVLNITHAPYVQPGLAFPVGVTGMEMTVRDQGGNEAICEFDVVVRDVQIPQIGVPDGAGKQCGGPRVATTAFDDITKVNTVSYAETYSAICPNGYSCQPLSGSLVSTCQPHATCTATTLVQNGGFGTGDMSEWPCFNKAGDNMLNSCHVRTDYEGHSVTGHLHSHCASGGQGGIQQQIAMAAGDYKLKFKAFAGTEDNAQAAADTDDMQIQVVAGGTSVVPLNWTTLAIGPETWQDQEVSFTVPAGLITIQMWADDQSCIDVDDIVLESCVPTIDPNAPSVVPVPV
jgi:hypothetical protein